MSRKITNPVSFNLEKDSGRLGFIRSSKGLSQKSLAELVGSTPAAIANVERGKNRLSRLLATSVARELGANVTWLLTGEGEPWIPQDKSERTAPSADADPESRKLAEAISRLSPDQRQAVAEVVQQLLKAPETASEPTTKPEPAPKPELAPTHTLRSGQVINIDDYRALLSEDAQGDLTDQEVAAIAQFEESCIQKGVRFHDFNLKEIFDFSANRIRELIDMGRQVDLC